MKPSLWRRAWLGIAAASVGAVAVALISQHVFEMYPCPWCILQRLIYLVIAALAGVTAFLPGTALRRVGAVGVVVLTGCGIASAVYQHQVASTLLSCNLTLADTILTALGLEDRWPVVFQVTASCADAATTMVGLPYEYWSLLLYALIAIAAVALFRHAGARSPERA